MSAALERLKERFEADPGDVRAFGALEEHYSARGAREELLRLYRRRLNAPDLTLNPPGRARILFRLGQLLEEQEGGADEALRSYEQAARLDPGFRPALRRLRGVYAARRQWELVLQLGELELECPMGPEEQADLRAELGEVWSEQLREPAHALSLFERALAEYAGSARAGQGLARALEALGRHAEAAEAWERQLARGPGRERAEALVALGRLRAGPLGDAEGAFDAFRRAVTEDPTSPAAVEGLTAIAARRERWPLVADLQERRFELESEPRKRLAIALEAGELRLKRLGDARGARLWLGRALEIDAGSAVVQLALADVERVAGDPEALLRRLHRAIELAGDAAPIEALLEAAELHAERRAYDAALELLRRAASRAPERVEVLDALVSVSGRAGRRDELLDLLEGRASLPGTEPSARAALLARLGALHEEGLGDPEEACDAYRRAFTADPTSPGVAAALERLLRKVEAWAELREVLETARHSAPEGERAALLCSLGELLAERFGAGAGARTAFEEALARDPAAARPLRGLQRLALASGDEQALVASYAREAEVSRDPQRLAFLVRELVSRLAARGEIEESARWVEHLAEAAPGDRAALETCARLHESLGRVEPFLASLERLDPLLTPGEQAANRRRLAAVHASGGREPEAIRWYQAALEADPNDLASLRALVAPLRRSGRLRELVRVSRRLVELLPPAERAPRLAELAELLSGPLNDPDSAIVVLWRLVEDPHAPPDVDAHLEVLLESTGRVEELAQRLGERRHALPASSPEALALDLRRADLLGTRLGHSEEAAELYRAILARRPDCPDALAGLEQLVRGSRDPGELAAVLAARAAAAASPEERAELELERAALLEEALGDDAGAREVYGRLAEDGGPAGARAAERLDRLLERSGAWRELCARLQSRAQRGSAEARSAARARLAQLCRERLADPAAAAAHLEAALQLTPGVAELWQQLGPLYEELERLPELRRALEGELATGPDRERELGLRARAAALCRGPLGEPEAARSHYERVIELAPGHADAVAFLGERLEREERWSELVALLEGRLAALVDPGDASRRSDLRLRLAHLRAERQGDVRGAIAVLEPALRETGPTGAPAGVLADLYARAGLSDALLELCRAAVARGGDPAERADWNLRLGQLLRERRDAAGAVEAFRRVLLDRPGDLPAETALRELHRCNEEPEPLARLLEAELARVAGPKEVPLRLELAALLEGPLGRPADALVHLRRVLEIEPGHPEALERGVSAAERIGTPELLREALDAALGATRDERRRAALLARRGELLAGALEQPEEAARAFREAVALDPTHLRARRGLRATLEALGDWAGVLDSLLFESHRAAPDERAKLFDEGSRVAERHLGPDAALPWLERLRAARPEDPEVAARIADVHRRGGRPEALLRALEEEVALARDPARRRALHVERARLLEDALGSPARAVAALEAASADGSEDPEILAALDRLLAAAGRDRERAEVLERRLALTPPPRRGALQRELAALYLGSLGEPARAAVHLGAARDALGPEVRPNDEARLDLLRSYARALRESGRLDAWARTAEEELRALDSDAPVFAERRAELRRELAGAYERELARPDAALVHLRALADQAHLAEDDDVARETAARAQDALIEHLRAEGSSAALARELGRRLRERPGPDDAAAWLELGRLREERLHEAGGAAQAYAEALERDPEGLAALRGLRRVAERRGDWEQVAAALEQEVKRLAGAPAAERAALWRRLGEVARRRLQATTRARRAFAAALEADPNDLAALRAAQELCEAMEDWRGALELYEREIPLLGDRDTRRTRAVHLRIAELARDRLDDGPRAIAALEAADALAPLAPHRRAALAELYRRAGDLAAYVRTALAWCDQPESGATAADRLLVCDALEALGRPEEALRLALRAAELDDRGAESWERAAELSERQGDARGATRALLTCAERSPDQPAAEHLRRAAELFEAQDPEQAAGWLRRAVERDPGAARAHAALARVAAALGAPEDAERAAARALDLGAGGSLDEATRLATALLGARAARELGHLEGAARFAAAARALAPDSPDALAFEGDALFSLGDLAGARRALEARLALEGEDPERGRHLALLGTALEAAGEHEEALARFEEALAIDPSRDEAHAGLVRLRERAGRLDDAYAAALTWARRPCDPAARAGRLVRAAELELARGGSEDVAHAHLREALAADPGHTRAGLLLTLRLAERGAAEEALTLSERVLATRLEPDSRARLCLLRARLLEVRGDRRAAAEACRLACEADPGQVRAALARARLLRGLGEWRAAADGLAEFAAAQSGGDPAALAQVHFQRARLLAGPLEDVDGALAAYRAALAADPHCREARESLAALLVHRPGCREEALARHRELLAEVPTRVESLRALIQLARARGGEGTVRQGLVILAALGAASAAEREGIPRRLSLRVGEEPSFADPVWEAARRVAREAGEELARALGASPSPAAAASDDPCGAFRAAAVEAEGELGAAALVPVSTPELAEALRLVAHLAVDARPVRGDGRLVNALSQELGRRARRRVRRALGAVTPSDLDAVDFEAWRGELRALARARALDATGGDLRPALCALVETGPEGEARRPAPEADLCALVADSPEASGLLRRVVQAWLAALPGERPAA